MDYLIPRLAVKYAIFTLGCRKLTERLPQVAAALNADKCLNEKRCYEDFDDALREFFNGCREVERSTAARRFVDGWRVKTQYYEESKAWPLLAEAADRTLEEAEGWDYRADIEYWHQVALSLAQEYFAATPYSEISEKLGKRVLVVYPSGGRGDYYADPRANPFGQGAPVAYKEHYQDSDTEEILRSVVLVRSESARNLALYLCYTLMFLHEYTAHIFVNDYEVNDIFNDGWMLFAAVKFLNQESHKASKAGTSFPLNRAQVNIFEEEFLQRMKDNTTNHIPLRGYAIANEIYTLLEGEEVPLSFESMTHQLAAFVPRPEESKQWPTKLIYRLGDRLRTENYQQVLTRIRPAKDIRELYARLS